MAADEGEPPPPGMEESHTPPEVSQVWSEVGKGLDKNQTVVWARAVESLSYVDKFLQSFPEGRMFAEKYMTQIISILVEQQPAKIGVHEKNCVAESLVIAVKIVADDLQIKLELESDQSFLIDTLSFAFNKKKAFYKGSKGNWNVNHMQGLPEVRTKTIERFRAVGGFQIFSKYIVRKSGTPFFPKLEVLHHVLLAASDTMVPNRASPPDQGPTARDLEDDAILVAEAVMHYINGLNEDALKKIPTDLLTEIQHDLQRIFDRLILTRRTNVYGFYSYWRALVLKLITSQSLPLKLFGWEQVSELIDACAAHRPPPRSFIVSTAGAQFVNGPYHYNGPVSEDGYARSGGEVSYVRKIPENEPGAGKKLTLFRCTMRSQQKWWFLSEADEEQPGTDRDIDYYQHKSKEHEEAFPPPDGWFTCRSAGVDPPPRLQPEGVLVPPGQELETLDHQLAKWAIENEIVEQVLGDTTIHREVVARSTSLIKFLASMCERYKPVSGMGDGPESKRYCLQTSHLLFAWKTCLRKADAAVSSQVYQLLVSILPLCPVSLAIPLLQAVQKSLQDSNDKRDYLFEVSEFCSALASGNIVDNRAAPTPPLRDEVLEEILNLLWSVLTHCDPSSLRSYDSLRRYVAFVLRLEPKGREHREKFLKLCVESLKLNTTFDRPVDEVQALRMVKLTCFVIDSCPRDQAGEMVASESGTLPILLFQELMAYLRRRRSGSPSGFARKASTASTITLAASAEDESTHHLNALGERMQILRHIYGLLYYRATGVEAIAMSFDMIESLWQLCDSPESRELLMVFIASGSQISKVTRYDHTVLPGQAEQLLSAAFPETVCRSVFIQLFCSTSFSYENLGEGAYRSFQYMFSTARRSQSFPSVEKDAALDALWRLCLTVGDDRVAAQAMKDLLGVYVALPASVGQENGHPNGPEQMVTDEKDDNFCDRMFQCLSSVKEELCAETPSATRSVDRCLRILNASIGQGSLDSHSVTSSTLIRLCSLDFAASLDKVFKCVPHGLRGQASYRRVGILAKRPQAQSQASGKDQNSPRPPTTLKFSLDLHPLETLTSVKYKVARQCNCPVASVKPLQVNGRAQAMGIRSNGDTSHVSLNVVPGDSVVDELGIVDGCEMVFVIADRPVQNNSQLTPASTSRASFTNDLSSVFFNDDGKFADRLFDMLLGIMTSLPWKEREEMMDGDDLLCPDTHQLVWDVLLALPTNQSISSRVRSAQGRLVEGTLSSAVTTDDAMDVDSGLESWDQLLDLDNFDRSVYVLQTIDGFLRPAAEVLSIMQHGERHALQQRLLDEAHSFRLSFIAAGGFTAVVRFLSESDESPGAKRGKTRRGNAVSLNILKSCLFGGHNLESDEVSAAPDEVGSRLLASLSDADGLLRSLISMVVDDPGISSATISDVLRFLRLLFQSPAASQSFVSLPDSMAERFLIVALLHDEETDGVRTSSSLNAAVNVRRGAHDLILQAPLLANRSLSWLLPAVDKLDVASETTEEYFDVLEKLVAEDGATARSSSASETELRELALVVGKKLPSCPRPLSETDLMDFSTGVLCGCLKLLRALIETGMSEVLRESTSILLRETGIIGWSVKIGETVLGDVVSSAFGCARDDDSVLLDLMGAIFDGFLSPGGLSSVPVCCDKESRRKGFDVVGAAARYCKGDGGYMALVARINSLASDAAPHLRHRWGQFGQNGHEQGCRGKSSSKYSGLRNQGCTCYMNSVLQQLFMMPELRDSLCSASLPSRLRSLGSAASNGPELVGKRISLQWENGVSYDAVVEGFDPGTGMHCIRYCSLQVATVSSATHHQVDPDEVARLPPQLPDEFILSDGRPGKETGVFEIVKERNAEASDSAMDEDSGLFSGIQETEDEAASRHLLEEVQRTFIHLFEGSRGRCFDPRALVEACACLKLEFDVWQQNDASEFTTKLLDRLEISLKKYAPGHFRYMDHTFGLKQTKQKICKECGMKTNREEKLLNIDCQIRGKADIHEALAAMTEVEIMEGSNKVFCDNCKKNTDTILRTAISALPNMLILSLKRFDLDFNTFETVKLNSRCAFGETLNLKEFTLEGLEAMEGAAPVSGDPSPMETDEEIPAPEDEMVAPKGAGDDDYQYRLAGVLVHAGVAQGGHYYSFIKDRVSGPEGKWYRFDDEDVTPFDPAAIEAECFGGKVKKETKWPNGQVHTVEQEQFANALMLFYEKVKPSDPPDEREDKKDELPNRESTASGYDVFKADVRRSNATHTWQSFLFDAEFLMFLKGLLGLCSRPREYGSSLSVDVASSAWQPAVLQMLLSFVFDILLYSSDKSFLGDWTGMIEESFHTHPVTAKWFVYMCAVKTRQVSSNWVRTYLLDCPDPLSRTSCVRILNAGIVSCATFEDELEALDRWCEAWEKQMASFVLGQAPVPFSLMGEWSDLEDTGKLGTRQASSIGIILSFLNVLLAAIPRCWRFSSDVGALVRELASAQVGNRGYVMRRPMTLAQIPPRLIALATRERLLPHHMRMAFPGESISSDAASTQARAESMSSSSVMPLNSNHGMHGVDMNTQRGPTPADYVTLIEALTCTAGLPGTRSCQLVFDGGEMNRSRRRFQLTPLATQALSTIFEEFCASGAPGLGQRDIENYLHRCGVDTTQVSSQKIVDMLAKYPTTAGNGSTGATYLSLDGFLAYYRDAVQNIDTKLRADLHTFGFRPDLTRRSEESRIGRIGERRKAREPAESIALDVAEVFGEAPATFGYLAEVCLSQSFQLYTAVLSVSEPLGLYLLAGAAYRKNCHDLIDRTLQTIYQSPNDWSGSDIVSAAVLALQVIASLPGPDVDDRIGRIMLSTTKVARNMEQGAGLLVVLQSLQQARPSPHYGNGLHWTINRYTEVLKTLNRNYAVFNWMSQNRSAWAFCERELFDSRPSAAHHSRPDRLDLAGPMRLGQPSPSDSDLAAMNDSDDAESHFEYNENESMENNGPLHIVLEGAGSSEVNGTYQQFGYFQQGCRYARDARYKGEMVRFFIFQCNVSNNTKHWYISIVPPGNDPGTSSDIDFYTAPVDEESRHIPPLRGWVKAAEGLEPTPRVEHSVKADEDLHGTDAIWDGSIEEDENHDNRNPYV